MTVRRPWWRFWQQEESVWKIEGINPPRVAVDGSFHMPYPTRLEGSVHHITRNDLGSLAGKSKLSLRVKVEMLPGVKVVPRLFPLSPSMLTLFIQRRGDNWSGVGAFEVYRWYAAFAKFTPVVNGEFLIEASLTGNWSAVLRSTRQSNPVAFQVALAEAENVGFVLGGGDGLAHGCYATGPCKFTILDFKVT